MKPFVAIGGVLDNRFKKVFCCISVEDCAQTEILVTVFGADCVEAALLCAQASNPQTPILVCAQSPILMLSVVADFPLSSNFIKQIRACHSSALATRG